MKKHVVLLRVGIDSGSGGIQGPLFDDGSFDFLCIPDGTGVSTHTYGNLVGRSGRPLLDYFPKSCRERIAAQHVHVDPEFDTFTYGDPATSKRSLRWLKPGDFLVFYCGLQRWDPIAGWKNQSRPALYLAGYFEVSLAGMTADFSERQLQTEFGANFHVRHLALFKRQKEQLVLVKGGPGSRVFRKAYRISAEGKDNSGKPLKVLSPKMRQIFGDFGGRNSIQRSPPRWVASSFVNRSIGFLKGLE